MFDQAECKCEAQGRHLLIAGTGRAGTSFLVRYLDAFGLDTCLSRAGDARIWDERANCGLEDMLLPDPSALPYVVKSPWTYQFIDELLGNPSVRLDAAIIPMRDLVEAATSRSIVELQTMHHAMPGLGQLEQTWEEWCHTTGGTVFSVNPMDQARLLAIGFHRLLERLVAAEVPVVLLSFPALIENADYLFRKLAPVLPAGSTIEQARRIHARLADPAMVRVGRELEPPRGTRLKGPTTRELERLALVRELARVQARLDAVTGSLSWRTGMVLRRLVRRVPVLHRLARRVAGAILSLPRGRSRQY